MWRPWRKLAERWRHVRSAAKSRNEALRFIAEYAALRVWTLVIGCFPIEANLVTARLMGRCWWLMMKKHQNRALDHLRPSFPELSDAQLRRIAQRSFEHFAQIYLVELVMTPRLVNEWSWARYVELRDVAPVVRELLSDRGVIMITPHFGNYELLGYAMARLGLPLVAVMRPLDNPLINEHLEASRAAGGVTLLYKKGASAAAGEIIAGGGTLCFIADQDAGRKGIFADFFNRKASWYKSIGLLAMQYDVPIVIGTAARQGGRFRYAIEVQRIIRPEDWADRDDRLQWVTDTFAKALEDAIRKYPEQYLWVHRRWKSRPRDERQATQPAAS